MEELRIRMEKLAIKCSLELPLLMTSKILLFVVNNCLTVVLFT